MNRLQQKFKHIATLINVGLFFIVTILVIKVNSLYTKFEIKVDRFNEFKRNYIEQYVALFNESGANVAVYFKDISTNYTIEIEPEKKIPSASLIKIPIMAAVYYLADKGELSLDEEIVYKKKHRCGGSGIIKNCRYGEKFTIRKLLELMITISDNVATHMIIDKVGLKRFNEIFKNMGLKNTNLDRYVMDLNARNKGIENYITVEDIGKLLERIYYGKLVSKEASMEMLKIMMEQKIDDRIRKKLPKDVIVANKTGLMKDVCHDAGIVFTNKGDFILCVLTENLDHKVAKNFIADLAYKAYSLYSSLSN